MHIPSTLTTYGTPPNFWTVNTETNTTDLTRGTSKKESELVIKTSTGTIVVDASKSAVVIIDMQNFFLSPQVRSHPLGLACVKPLIEHAIPVAHESGIKVIYLNWGLTEEDLTKLPPQLQRGFSRGGPGSLYAGLGVDLGDSKGRTLMRDTWNAEIYPELYKAYDPKKDIVVHKNRLSGMWGRVEDGGTELQTYLEKEGITTLFFSGVNSNQCVSGSLIDACSRGYDCILLSDCCATSSPLEEHQIILNTAAKSWGFLCTAADMRGPKEKTAVEDN